MSALPFPSGQRLETGDLPGVCSGRTTLGDGSEGAQVQPELAKVPAAPAGMKRLSTDRLFLLADELGALAAIESYSEEPWLEYARLVERQAIGELARRAI